MNPAEIRQYIGAQSQAIGIDPALSMGLAELTGYSPNWTDGKRAGIMSLPKDVIADQAAYQANPKAQINAGILALSKDVGELGDFAGLVKYTGSPKSAFKAYLRTARNRGQPVTEGDVSQSLQALGLDLDPVDEARKAGLALAQPTEQAVQQQAPAPQQAEPMQQPTQTTTPEQPDMSEALITSTPKQRASRIKSVFGGTDKDGDVPDDFLAYIKGLM